MRFSLRPVAISGFVSVALWISPTAAMDIEVSGYVEPEWRHFTNDGPTAEHESEFGSFAGELELAFYSQSGDHAFIIKPFGRWDAHDHERTHADLREAKYQYVNGDWEIIAGIDKVFWGVTEFQHLVDIINQTDNVESADGEQKLGQPMIRVSLAREWGTLTGFYLPYFRLRQFPDPITGRPTTGIKVRDEKAIFESDHERFNPDAALRYTHSLDVFDFGVSYFKGTARTPVLAFTAETYDGVSVVPRYDLITQAGLDVQATLGPWLLKFEGTRREQQNNWNTRATGGVEYTLYNFFDTGTDLGVVAEYMYDARGLASPQPLNDDFGLGLRWTANDTQSTAFLLGGIYDLETDSTALSLEAERRLGASFKAQLEVRIQETAGTGDTLANALIDEDMVRFRIAYYF